MSAISGTDTAPELLIRSALHRRGFRFRVHQRFSYVLDGKHRSTKPDLVLKKYRTVIMVNSCFWHWHDGCDYSSIPDTNSDFWRNKLAETRARDERNREFWVGRGWYIATVWECAIRDRPKNVIESMIDRLVAWLVRKNYRRQAVDFNAQSMYICRCE